MTTPTDHPRTFTARTPDDVLALVPVLLGFVPQESVVMLTFGAARCFHARVDLPPDPGEVAVLDELVELLLAPVRAHAVGRVLFVLYAADPLLAARAAERLGARFARSGVEVAAALRAHGGRWWAGRPDGTGFAGRGVPYDASAHPLTAEAVVGGAEILGSRQQLVEAMRYDAGLATGVLAALAELSAGPAAGTPAGTPADESVTPAAATVRREVATRVAQGLASCAGAGAPPDDRAIAWLLRALLHPAARDAVVDLVTRDTARLHIGFWTEVVRRAPDALVAAPAGLLAFAAWQAGDGARAWCAVDRCLEASPEDRFAHLVAAALVRAVPPDAWPGRPGGGLL